MKEIFPHNNFELKYSDLVPEVVEELKALKRTGWVNRGVENPETVYEHTMALLELVVFEINSLDEFSLEEKSEILEMLEIHDWAESDPKVGDRVILKANKNREILKKEKAELELETMTRICEKLGEKGKRILELWLRFENNRDSVSSFSRQVDKLQAIEKAFEYEQNGEAVSTQEFIDGDEENITHPVLVKRLQMLKTKLKGNNK